MPLIKEWSLPPYLRLLVHGETGTGKTYLAGTSALVETMSPVLCFDFEEGRSSIFSIPGIGPELIYFWAMRGSPDLLELEKKFSAPGEFKTIIIDSMTEMYGLMMTIHLEAQGRAEAPPQIQDYGFVTNRMMKFLRKVTHDPKVHFVATAGTSLDKDDLSGEIHQQPDILGKMNFRAGRFFDILGYLSVSVEKRADKLMVNRSMQVQPFRRIRAKDRFSKLPPVMDNPSMKEIFELVYTERKDQSDRATSRPVRRRPHTRAT